MLLDEADGLDWETLCKCDLFHLVLKSKLTDQRGQVTPERRRTIIRMINRCNDWI